MNLDPKLEEQNLQIEEWLRLSPEERILEAEQLWEEFKIKYPKKLTPFWKGFSSFEEYREWLQSQDPSLW